ncbi:TraR/DksA family transcriptional regulator [Nocardioides lijunqiniae]|uniref:TraR/DksA family transcriptional regulator n=1 Tax=Nocardioides lijunqiniae TaxID=2760832 RepID=UPI001878E848|nr:TraR/DksA C4-type zinc finger protein [Nocardioides lijunqiniae]
MTLHHHRVSARPDPGLDAHLAELQESRQRQLDAMPESDLDAVAAAYRGTVTRILDEVRTARRRVQEGRYGTCVRCDLEISAQRLELRPWVVMCTACSGRDRH